MIDDENEGTEPCGHTDRLALGFSSTISRIPLPFLGLAAYRAWLNVAFSKDIFGTGPAFFFSQNAFDLTLAVSMLACVLLARWLTPLHAHTWPRIVCAGLLVFATFLGFIPLWGPSPGWLLLASTVVGGVGTTLVILLWSELYGRLTPVRACLYYSASLVVAAGLSWMYEGFKIDWLPIMVPLLPLVSMAFFKPVLRPRACRGNQGELLGAFFLPLEARAGHRGVLICLRSYAVYVFQLHASRHVVGYGGVCLDNRCGHRRAGA